MKLACYYIDMPYDFAAAAHDLGFDLDAATLDRFRTYRERIAGAGFNLTSARDRETIERRHFLESLAIGRLLAERGLLADSTCLLDIGTGAGFPGLPLKLVRPDLRVTLIESHGKKCAFLRELIAELCLDGVEVLEGRAEAFARESAHRGAYDLVVARAVAPLPVLLEYALPYLRVEGRLAAIKGSSAGREIEEAGGALAALGGVVEDTLSLQPPDGVAQTIIVVRQVTPAPERYPRRIGIPTKRPLG